MILPADEWHDERREMAMLVAGRAADRHPGRVDTIARGLVEQGWLDAVEAMRWVAKRKGRASVEQQ